MRSGVAVPVGLVREARVAVLTPKQEKFAQCVASGMNQSDAYRAAFNADRMKANSINVNASKMMADAKVALRVAELRVPIVERVGITLESHLADLQDLRDRARDAEQYSAAIAAEVARGKASGVHIERTASTVTVETEDESNAEAAARRLEMRAAERASSRATH